MELWIRSQNRMAIEKINGLNIVEVDNGLYDICKGFITYGTYKTKERALEVLDEIQNVLKPPVIFQEHEGVITTNDNSMHIINPTYGEIKQLETIVYEMPKE